MARPAAPVRRSPLLASGALADHPVSDLLHAAAFRRVVGFLRLVVALLRFRVRNLDVLLDLVDRQNEQGELARFRRHERRLVRLVGRLQLGLVRLGHIDGDIQILRGRGPLKARIEAAGND